jgi:hypothetical protein
MAETFTKDQFWGKLEELGEDQVRLNVSLQRYGAPNVDKRVLAEEWLRKKDQDRRSAREWAMDASSSENLRVARSAKNAAWAAAAMAAAAAITAAVSAVIAYLALASPK